MNIDDDKGVIAALSAVFLSLIGIIRQAFKGQSELLSITRKQSETLAVLLDRSDRTETHKAKTDERLNTLEQYRSRESGINHGRLESESNSTDDTSKQGD